MDRLQAFESMLKEIQTDFDFKKAEMDKLQAKGREKSATFKQYMADKLLYQRIFALYDKYGLL